MLEIYDSLNRSKRLFVPLDKNKKNVTMYVCGVTTYDFCHLGHARTYVAFDMIYRYLQYLGYNVTYIRNITDIDDKIIKRANDLKITTHDLSSKYIAYMHEDFANLNLLPPTSEPKAIDYIAQMINFIKDLIKKDFAYVGNNNDVYFDINNFTSYGRLSNQKLDYLIAGMRVEENTYKKNPLDFVLWKSAKPSEPSWDSPWGAGRPGWHIECSAMLMAMLGSTVDIHGGGFDLRFPHHENERAQSCAKNDHELANYWCHVGFLTIDSTKMSKSLNNFLTIRDALKEYDKEVLRYFFLMSHYRSEINFSLENLTNAKNSLDKLYNTILDLHIKPIAFDEIKNNKNLEPFYLKFLKALDDDFNTPEAFGVLFAVAKEVNKYKDSDNKLALEYANLLKHFCNIFAFLQYNPEDYFQKTNKQNQLAVSEIEAKILIRNTARKNKDWALSDKIRDELLAKGVLLEDSKDDTTWKYL